MEGVSVEDTVCDRGGKIVRGVFGDGGFGDEQVKLFVGGVVFTFLYQVGVESVVCKDFFCFLVGYGEVLEVHNEGGNFGFVKVVAGVVLGDGVVADVEAHDVFLSCLWFKCSTSFRGVQACLSSRRNKRGTQNRFVDVPLGRVGFCVPVMVCMVLAGIGPS